LTTVTSHLPSAHSKFYNYPVQRTMYYYSDTRLQDEKENFTIRFFKCGDKIT